jgi:hypothetical protein
LEGNMVSDRKFDLCPQRPGSEPRVAPTISEYCLSSGELRPSQMYDSPT